MMGVGEKISDLRDLLSIVAEETGALKMDDADEDSVGWTTEGPLPMTFGHVRRAHTALAAIEAALSTDAEPVAWWFEAAYNAYIFYPHEKARGEYCARLRGVELKPLYAEAVKTAPAVAVKALADAYQKYLDTVSLYNERHAVMKTKALGTMRVDEEYKAIDAARRAFDKLAVEVATSAVSAQVQDVAEVSPAEYMRRHDAAIAAYEANTPSDYRYSALALRKAVDAAFEVTAAPAAKQGEAE